MTAILCKLFTAFCIYVVMQPHAKMYVHDPAQCLYGSAIYDSYYVCKDKP